MGDILASRVEGPGSRLGGESPTTSPPMFSPRDLILHDDALSTKPVMHYHETAYLCY